ncbi:response regulator [Chitinimonas sp.]|uniref:response regulator n=1 Tax=Chitinimonas sp. TaxID=1934313 RepID=UPI002F9256A9
MRILLVEDDAMIGEAMVRALKAASYAVDWVQDGSAALTAFESQHYGLILLDLGLPRRDGLEVLQRIRRVDPDTSVLIVTARDEVEERIRGLDLGADDYVPKPFEMSELLARMRAVIRRRGGNGGPLMVSGQLTLDPATRQARYGEQQAQLSGKEFALLQALLLRPGAILSRRELEDRIYGWNEEVESNAIEFLIHAIRKKLGSTVIRNIRGVGWLVSRES